MDKVYFYVTYTQKTEDSISWVSTVIEADKRFRNRSDVKALEKVLLQAALNADNTILEIKVLGFSELDADSMAEAES